MQIKLRFDPTIVMTPVPGEPGAYLIEPKFFHPDARVLLAQIDVTVPDEQNKPKLIDSSLLIVSGSNGKVTRTGAETNVKPRVETGKKKRTPATTGGAAS